MPEGQASAGVEVTACMIAAAIEVLEHSGRLEYEGSSGLPLTVEEMLKAAVAARRLR